MRFGLDAAFLPGRSRSPRDRMIICARPLNAAPGGPSERSAPGAIAHATSSESRALAAGRLFCGREPAVWHPAVARARA
jgi:hypothetical protein